jgi:hypothetical protein
MLGIMRAGKRGHTICLHMIYSVHRLCLCEYNLVLDARSLYDQGDHGHLAQVMHCMTDQQQ